MTLKELQEEKKALLEKVRNEYKEKMAKVKAENPRTRKGNCGFDKETARVVTRKIQVWGMDAILEVVRQLVPPVEATPKAETKPIAPAVEPKTPAAPKKLAPTKRPQAVNKVLDAIL